MQHNLSVIRALYHVFREQPPKFIDSMRESESQDQFGDERPVGEKVFFCEIGKAN